MLNQIAIDVSLRKRLRTIITIPPRHGKSEIMSRWYPAWHIGNNPDDRVILTSYVAGFAAEWGRKARDIIELYGAEYFGVRIRQDVAAREHWEVEKAYRNGESILWRPADGGMHTSGMEGTLTGRGGDIIIIDDPVKNAEEAFSATKRQNVWEWFDSTLMSRAEPNAAVILIMTRWHEDDLAGRLIDRSNNGGEHWDVINLPALAEEADPLGRAEGEALWPERYPQAELEAIRVNRGAYWFSAMYQQRPVPVGKGLFTRENTRRYTHEHNAYWLHQPDGSKIGVADTALTRFATVDLATSLKQTADFTVVSTWGMTANRDVLLLDSRHVRLEGPDQTPLMREVWLTQRPAAFYVEATGYQLSLVQTAIRAGLPIFPIYPDTDKVARALTAAARFASGNYYFPVAADWLPECEKELYRFPAGEHDDFVDTVSYSALVAIGGGYVGNI